MRKALHFVSGLPRSGSTLLSAIRRQDLAFQAAMTSPVGSLYLAMEGVFSGYYHAAEPGAVLFNTNRLWCARMPALAELFPQAQVICCVRNLAWIMTVSSARGSAIHSSRPSRSTSTSAARSTPGQRVWRRVTAWSAMLSTRCAKLASGRFEPADPGRIRSADARPDGNAEALQPTGQTSIRS